MNKLLTVSVAAYNMEAYLRRTLDSLCVPEVCADMDVIVVDDGSTDSTAKIAAEYIERYPETFRLISKANGGYGSTVNAAVKIACGKYFRLLDGDDWLESAALTDFIELLKNSQEDIVLTRYRKVYTSANTEETCGYGDVPENTVFGFDEYADRLEPWIYSMTIRTDILRSHGITLSEHRFYSDMEFLLLPVPWCDTVRTSSLELYRYRLGRAGQSVELKSFARNYDHHLALVKGLLEFFAAKKDWSEARRQYFLRRLLYLVDMQYNIFYFIKDKKTGKRLLLDFDAYLKKNHSEIYEAEKAAPCTTQRLMQMTVYRGFSLAAWFKQKFKGGY